VFGGEERSLLEEILGAGEIEDLDAPIIAGARRASPPPAVSVR